jgi:hypothetical protein
MERLSGTSNRGRFKIEGLYFLEFLPVGITDTTSKPSMSKHVVLALGPNVGAPDEPLLYRILAEPQRRTRQVLCIE